MLAVAINHAIVAALATASAASATAAAASAAASAGVGTVVGTAAASSSTTGGAAAVALAAVAAAAAAVPKGFLSIDQLVFPVAAAKFMASIVVRESTVAKRETAAVVAPLFGILTELFTLLPSDCLVS